MRGAPVPIASEFAYVRLTAMSCSCLVHHEYRYKLSKGECFRTVSPPAFGSGMGLVLPLNATPLAADMVHAAAPVTSGLELFKFTATSQNADPGPVRARTEPANTTHTCVSTQGDLILPVATSASSCDRSSKDIPGIMHPYNKHICMDNCTLANMLSLTTSRLDPTNNNNSNNKSYSHAMQITFRLEPLQPTLSLATDGVLTTAQAVTEYRQLTVTVVATEDNPNCIVNEAGTHPRRSAAFECYDSCKCNVCYRVIADAYSCMECLLSE